MKKNPKKQRNKYRKERKLFLFVLLFLMLSPLLSAQNQAQPDPLFGPDIRFDEPNHDFGKIEQTDKIEHVFKFRNIGLEKLVITEVKTFCGCTASVLSDTTILPDEEGELKVTIDTKGEKGSQGQVVYVYSNDPLTPLVKLSLEAVIETDLSVSQKSINFGSLKKNVAAKRRIYLSKIGDENLKIVKVESSSNYILTASKEVLQTRDKNLKQFEATVSTARNIPLGKFEEKLVIYTNDKKYPQVEIPVFGDVKGDIEFSPPSFFFGFVNRFDKPSCKVTVFTTGEKVLKIEKVSLKSEQTRFSEANSLADYISVSITPKTEGKEYEITATLGYNAPLGNLKGSVIVYTNNPGQPEVEIPVYGLVQN